MTMSRNRKGGWRVPGRLKKVGQTIRERSSRGERGKPLRRRGGGDLRRVARLSVSHTTREESLRSKGGMESEGKKK